MAKLSSLIGEEADVLGDTNLQLLLLVNMVGPLGSALLSPIMDSLIGPFEASTANIGFMMSAFTAPAILMIPLAGWLSDMYGRKPLIISGLIIFGSSGTFIAFITDFYIALGLRLIQGIGFAAITPVVITSIGDLYGGTREATAQGLRFSTSGLTHMFTPIFAGLLVGIAWEFPFLLFSVSFPIAILVYLWYDGQNGVLTNGKKEFKGNSPITKSPTLFSLLRYRRVQALIFLRGLPGIAWIAFLTYNSIIVTRFAGGDPAQAGMLAAIASLSFAIAATQAGRLTSFSRLSFYPLLVAHLSLGLGLIIIFHSSFFPYMVGGGIILGCGFGITLSIYRSIITSLVPASKRGSLVSVAESFGRLTITMTPILMAFSINNLSNYYSFRLTLQIVGHIIVILVSGGGALGLIIARYTHVTPYQLE